MSKLTPDQIAQLPAADFAFPASRIFPVVDQADVQAARGVLDRDTSQIATATKVWISQIAARKGLDVPGHWSTGCPSAARVANRTPPMTAARKAELLARHPMGAAIRARFGPAAD